LKGRAVAVKGERYYEKRKPLEGDQSTNVGERRRPGLLRNRLLTRKALRLRRRERTSSNLTTTTEGKESRRRKRTQRLANRGCLLFSTPSKGEGA